MLRIICFLLLLLLPAFSSAYGEEKKGMEEPHIHFESGVVYFDVQTFNQEAYVLKVLGSGSPMTMFWQFEVLQQRHYFFNKSIALIRLGRQVIPDLVTKRWLMRDLSGGVVSYTTDAHEAMRFLTEMDHVAIVDVSVLEPAQDYVLETTFYIYEGEQEETGWWSSLTSWGEDMGSIYFKGPLENVHAQ